MALNLEDTQLILTITIILYFTTPNLGWEWKRRVEKDGQERDEGDNYLCSMEAQTGIELESKTET